MTIFTIGALSALAIPVTDWLRELLGEAWRVTSVSGWDPSSSTDAARINGGVE